MTEYGYEIDFLPVGNGDKSGDAIIIRYRLNEDYKIMVIDGGTKESGEEIVRHIKKYYNTDRVDYLVNTHPDADHASGLEIVLEELQVGEVWVHRPWVHPHKIRHLFKDGRITDNSLSDRLREGLRYAHRLEELAKQKNIKVNEPYTGSCIGIFRVLSPDKDWYLDLVPQFNKTPDAYKAQESLTTCLQEIKNSVREYIGFETLSEDGETSAENESSVILYANIAGHGILLTGDAGNKALNRACDYAEQLKIDLQSCHFIQVPHHGSRNNVSPSTLNRLIGPITSNHALPPKKIAYISVSKNSTTHPRKQVTNAFYRRGVEIHQTKGLTKRHSYNMGKRAGWIASEPIPFYDLVEGE